MSGKRVKIVLDYEVDKKIRELQAKAIRSTSSSVSFSKVINDLLRNSLKK